MSTLKEFVNADIRRTKALAIALRTDPVFTSISVLGQTLVFAAFLWLSVHTAKWAFATITSAF